MVYVPPVGERHRIKVGRLGMMLVPTIADMPARPAVRLSSNLQEPTVARVAREGSTNPGQISESGVDLSTVAMKRSKTAKWNSIVNLSDRSPFTD